MDEQPTRDITAGWQVHETRATPAAAKPIPPAARDSQADQLAALAFERYRVGRTDKGEAFAVLKLGPNIARMLRGGSDALRALLAREHSRRFDKVPSSTALSDAMNVVEGAALESPPEPVHLRVARHGPSIVLDLGDEEGRAVIVNADGWRVVDRSPVLFHRTALTGAIPTPTKGGSIEDLRELLNVEDSSWPLVLGWLVASLIPDIPRPILLLSGEQGAGKSTAARILAGLVDPGPALLRSPPRDLEQWSTAASGSWIVTIDNVSSVPDWWSDALCRAVTGDGLVRRKLYSDSALSVLEFLRAIILTGIDLSALRGDLGERLLIVELTRIMPTGRRSHADLVHAVEESRPALLGGLLSLLSDVLAELPDVRLAEMPRMADFARVLGAMDQAIETDAVGLYARQAGRIAEEVIESDAIASALIAYMEALAGTWIGTASELLGQLPKPANVPHSWPKNGRAMGSRLRRLAPALRTSGLIVEGSREAGSGKRIWRLEAPRTPASLDIPAGPTPNIGDQP